MSIKTYSEAIRDVLAVVTIFLKEPLNKAFENAAQHKAVIASYLV